MTTASTSQSNNTTPPAGSSAATSALFSSFITSAAGLASRARSGYNSAWSNPPTTTSTALHAGGLYAASTVLRYSVTGVAAVAVAGYYGLRTAFGAANIAASYTQFGNDHLRDHELDPSQCRMEFGRSVVSGASFLGAVALGSYVGGLSGLESCAAARVAAGAAVKLYDWAAGT
jgi:hypothetical protein